MVSGEGGLTIAVGAGDFQLPPRNAPSRPAGLSGSRRENHRFMWRNQGRKHGNGPLSGGYPLARA